MKVIVTQEKLKGLIRKGRCRRVVQIDGEWREISKESRENPEKQIGKREFSICNLYIRLDGKTERSSDRAWKRSGDSVLGEEERMEKRSYREC